MILNYQIFHKRILIIIYHRYVEKNIIENITCMYTHIYIFRVYMNILFIKLIKEHTVFLFSLKDKIMGISNEHTQLVIINS